MRLLFLGCSWTAGAELEDKENTRFSTILGKHLNAEVVNVASGGSSNHRIARFFLKQDLESFDKIFAQLTLPSRTEWYDSTGNFNKAKIRAKMKANLNWGKKWYRRQLENLGKKFVGEWDRILVDEERYLITGNLLEGKEWWIHYFEDIYQDEYGITEEMLIFNLIKNKLKRLKKDHLIFSINGKCTLPIDLQLNLSKYPRAKGNHPNEIGHSMIASDIIKLL
tara:strand:+ start:1186 stop:1854 length:669 start_codon:yes stop_codon:yes gene_type:complete